jgi:hypothetical protein
MRAFFCAWFSAVDVRTGWDQPDLRRTLFDPTAAAMR